MGSSLLVSYWLVENGPANRKLSSPIGCAKMCQPMGSSLLVSNWLVENVSANGKLSSWFLLVGRKCVSQWEALICFLLFGQKCVSQWEALFLFPIGWLKMCHPMKSSLHVSYWLWESLWTKSPGRSVHLGQGGIIRFYSNYCLMIQITYRKSSLFSLWNANAWDSSRLYLFKLA